MIIFITLNWKENLNFPSAASAFVPLCCNLQSKDQSSALIKVLFRSSVCLEKFKVSFDHLTA